jgi:hypothetical protein
VAVSRVFNLEEEACDGAVSRAGVGDRLDEAACGGIFGVVSLDAHDEITSVLEVDKGGEGESLC